MNKKSLVVVLILGIVIIGALAYALLSKNNQQPVDNIDNSQANIADEQQPIDDTNALPATPKGTYATYDSGALSQAKGAILLFFHAPWCPQCRAIEKTINESGIPDGVTVLKVDYDTSQALRQRYGVTLQTTFVRVDAQGNKLASYVAYDEPTFTSVQRELLP